MSDTAADYVSASTADIGPLVVSIDWSRTKQSTLQVIIEGQTFTIHRPLSAQRVLEQLDDSHEPDAVEVKLPQPSKRHGFVVPT